MKNEKKIDVEKIIADTPCTPVEHCTCEAKMSPEEEVRMLRRDIQTAYKCRDSLARDAEKFNVQARVMLDMLVECRQHGTNIENDNQFYRERLEDYRWALNDITRKCGQAIQDYENGVCKAGDICDLANAILKIVDRF